MKSLYLWLNIATISFPLLFTFDKRINFYKRLPFLLPAIIITGVLFLVWDQLFVIWHVWSFNPDYILGYYVMDLPIEEVLFFFTVPYACVFILESTRVYIKKDIFGKSHRYITLVFMLLSCFLFYKYQRQLYTTVTCLILFFLLNIQLIVIKRNYMSRFYLTYFISIIPMLIVNGILTAKPVVQYNPMHFTGIRLGTIPVEDFLYNLAMLLTCISLYEMFRRWGTRNRSARRKQSV